MTRLRLLPSVPALSVDSEKQNRLALLSVALEVRRELLWNPRLRSLLGPGRREARR